MDRRSFLVGAGCAIITAAFYRDVIRYTERRAAPLLIPPDNFNTILYALDDHAGGFDLYLGEHPHNDAPPRWTMRQLASARGYEEEEFISYLAKSHGLSEEDAEFRRDWDVDESEVVEFWARRDSANARAFYELQRLDLGPLAGTNRSQGEIRFIDGPCPGNDSLIVTAEDMTSLSLLQVYRGTVMRQRTTLVMPPI
jgi:hypothetical protein